ncbi:MAG: hypothetical protein U0271_18160 [Polyangiaceae bacterium]
MSTTTLTSHFTDRRWVQGGLFALVVAIMSYPALKHPPMDEFPLSAYPMFASNQNTQTTEVQLVGFDAENNETILGPEFSGTEEVLQARAALNRAVRGGRKTRSELCERVARDVAKKPALSKLVRVELRAVTIDSVALLTQPSSRPKAINVHAKCAVPR